MSKVQPILIGPLSSRTPGTNSSIKLPSTWKYLNIFLEMQVATVASITRSGANKWADYIDSVELRVNGSREIDLTPAVHEIILNTLGTKDVGNVFTIPLAMANMRLGAGEDMSGYGTLDVDNLDLVVKLKSGAHVIDRLDLSAMVHEVNEPLGRHLQIRRYPRSVAGAGWWEENSIWNVGEVLYGIAVTATNFDAAEVKQGTKNIHETGQQLRDAVGAMVGRENTGGYLDFINRDRLDEAHLVDAQDHRLRLNFDGAASPDVAIMSLSPAA